MSENKQKIYSAEFKESSVKLAITSTQPIAHTARELGVNENTLYSWVGKYTKTSGNFSNPVSHNNNRAYEEIMQLKKELSRVTQERDILKKAAAYFAKECK